MRSRDFAGLLKTTIGLDVGSIGQASVDRAVARRQRESGAAGVDAYWTLVNTSTQELQALIEGVVVPETWFFRDAAAFATLATIAGTEWLRKGSSATLRMLSLPCASGEEPYSMAMALLDAGVPPDRFRIDAVDVSERLLSIARKGMFSRTSFREADLEFRDRYFEPASEAYRISDAVRRQVSFHRGNLVAPSSLPKTGPWQVIFCRHLLIYFDGESRERAADTLGRVIAPHGWLFVGPSEAAAVGPRFVPAAGEVPGAFRKAVPARGVAASVRKPTGHKANRDRRHHRHSRGAARPTAHAGVPTSDRSTAGVGATLEEGRRLADRGCFAEARVWLETYLAREGPSAEALYLLGLVRDANGDHAAAVDCYRRALYLDPGHAETLLHLALLMDRLNSPAEAQRLRRRARHAAREVIT